MTTTLMAISTVLGAGGATRARPANARLAPGGQERRGKHDAGLAQNTQASEAARWQRVLDLLDPGKRCGAWCPATFVDRPVVCTRAPHDSREQHSGEPASAEPAAAMPSPTAFNPDTRSTR